MSLYPKHASAPVQQLVITDPRPTEIVEVKWDQYPDEPPFKIRRVAGLTGMAAWASMEYL